MSIVMTETHITGSGVDLIFKHSQGEPSAVSYINSIHERYMSGILIRIYLLVFKKKTW